MSELYMKVAQNYEVQIANKSIVSLKISNDIHEYMKVSVKLRKNFIPLSVLYFYVFFLKVQKLIYFHVFGMRDYRQVMN
jgi:hypothetical protein